MRERLITVATLIAVMVLGVMAPALATKPGEGGHKVTVCHATNSASNPFVVITIDVAAWEPGDQFVRHSPSHHQNSKSGHIDAVYDTENERCVAPPTDTSTDSGGPTDT